MPEDHITELKKVLATNKIVIGTSNTMKAIKKGQAARVYVSSNAPTQVKDDISHYQRLGKFEVLNLEVPNDELGTLCRKQFSVSVLCVTN